MFLRFTKVDAAQRIVYGVFTEEAPDRSNEIMDYAASKPHFEAWSQTMYKASGGKSYGNVRAMHKTVAAGLFAQPIEFNDETKTMSAAARVVDDDEWKKCEEGVYTGFSVGGRYLKRWTDPKNPTLIRYEADPQEVSLVDLPCVKGATFSFVKAEGAQPEDRLFKTVVETKDELPAPPPLSDPPELSDPPVLEKTVAPVEATLATPATPSLVVQADAPVQMWKAVDGSFHDSMEAAVKHTQDQKVKDAVSAAVSPAEAALSKLNTLLGGEATPPATPASGDAGKDVKVEVPVVGKTAEPLFFKLRKKALEALVALGKPPAKEVVQTAFTKGMWDIARVADIICDLKWLYECVASEAALEGDSSTIPADTKDIISKLVALLKKVVDEETSELLEDIGADVDITPDSLAGNDIIVVLAAAAGLDSPLRKSYMQMDGLPKTMAQLLKKADDDQANITKTVVTGTATPNETRLLKGLNELTEADLTPDNGALPLAVRILVQKNFGMQEGLTKMVGQMESMAARIEQLAKMPEPPKGFLKGVVRAVTKQEDSLVGGSQDALGGGGDAAQAYQKYLDALPEDKRAGELMKVALRNPVARIG